MCDWTTLSMLATISLYDSAVPSSLRWNTALPAALVPVAGTSLRPFRWAR